MICCVIIRSSYMALNDTIDGMQCSCGALMFFPINESTCSMDTHSKVQYLKDVLAEIFDR